MWFFSAEKKRGANCNFFQKREERDSLSQSLCAVCFFVKREISSSLCVKRARTDNDER